MSLWALSLSKGRTMSKDRKVGGRKREVRSEMLPTAQVTCVLKRSLTSRWMEKMARPIWSAVQVMHGKSA